MLSKTNSVHSKISSAPARWSIDVGASPLNTAAHRPWTRASPYNEGQHDKTSPGEATSASSAAPCRFLYLIGQLTPGGSERQLLYLLEQLNRRQYSPHVVVWNYREDDPYVAKIRALEVPLHALPYKGIPGIQDAGLAAPGLALAA